MSTAISSTPGAVGRTGDDRRIFGLTDTLFYRSVSIAAVFSTWEIAGLIPISVAFPTFSETM